MKKIIYSLVIMIAVGSLFTSCIEQGEPDGVKALREAKARYYNALSELRAKDGIYREAEAALKQAEAALKQAETAHQQAVTDAFVKMEALKRQLKELEIAEKTMENELKAQEVAQQIDKIKKDMAIAEQQHAIDLVNKQKELAQAQEALRVALRDIALAAQDLTAKEKEALLKAIEVYMKCFEEVADQKIVVMKAEKALADAKRAKETVDQGWDSETHSYQHQIDLYNRAIERAKGYIAKDEEALENVPTLPDVEAWQAELERYQAEANAAEYSRHKLTQEAAAYYVQYVHDGVKTYNDAIDAWVAKHPAVANPGAAPKPADYTPEAYKKNDTLTFKHLELPARPAFAKFEFLLGSYAQESPISGANPKNNFIFTNGGELAIVANYVMKDFILGTNLGDVGTQKLKYDNVNYTADYGLNGAVSVLLRDKVLNPDAPADPVAARAAADAAKAAWQADHDTLKNGLWNYKPYVDARAALAAAIAAAQDGSAGMVAAIKKLHAEIDKANGATVSDFDREGIMSAFIAFAKARETYLDKPAGMGPEADMFKYAIASMPPISREIKYTDLTLTVADPNNPANAAMEYTRYGYVAATGNLFVGAGVENPLAHIASQLLNPGYVAVFSGPTPWASGACNINANASVALYGAYEFVDEVDPTPDWIKDLATNQPYEPKNIAEAKAAVDAAIADYEKCYKRYWNAGWPAAGTIDHTTDSTGVVAALAANPDLSVERYSLATFTEPFIIVNSFSGAYNWDKTKAVLAILGSVDPVAVDALASNIGNGTDESIVLGTDVNPTDLLKYLYAEYLYYLATHPAIGDIATIKEWVADVTGVFDAHVTAAANAYSAAVDTYNAKKAKYDAYIADLKVFTGTNASGAPLGIKKITSTYDDVASIQYQFDLINEISGEWKLGGEQKTLAESTFPEFPVKLKDWYARNAKIDDDIAHAKALIDALKPAYYAAAKAAGYTGDLGAADYDELIEKYNAMRKEYVDKLKEDIEEQKAAIDANMKLIADFESGVPAADIAIAEAQAQLDKENKKLEKLEKALALAKESLDKLTEYLKSLDANYALL